MWLQFFWSCYIRGPGPPWLVFVGSNFEKIKSMPPKHSTFSVRLHFKNSFLGHSKEEALTPEFNESFRFHAASHINMKPLQPRKASFLGTHQPSIIFRWYSINGKKEKNELA